jgi:hypothetical protein
MAPNPSRSVNLHHRAFHLRGASRQSLCVAASGEGDVTLVDVDSGQTKAVAGFPKIRDICPHPTRPLLAVIDDAVGSLVVMDFEGWRVLEQQAPQPRKHIDRWLRPGFNGCFFDQAGDFLWSVARRSRETVEVQLRETERWAVVGSVAIEDPFEESHCSLHATSRSDVAARWLGAGQNGQRVFWVTKELDSLSFEPDPFLEDTTPPVFSPKGDEFLVIEGLWSVCKYRFPTDRKLGKCRSKWGSVVHPFVFGVLPWLLSLLTPRFSSC